MFAAEISFEEIKCPEISGFWADLQVWLFRRHEKLDQKQKGVTIYTVTP